jgi:hypothetical protein
MGFYMYRENSSKPYTIAAWHSEKEARDFFEEGYNRNHNRGYEASMSACINWILFNYSIVYLDLAEIKTFLVNEEAYRLRSISGSATLLKVDAARCRDLFESGCRPRLISEDTFKEPSSETCVVDGDGI